MMQGSDGLRHVQVHELEINFGVWDAFVNHFSRCVSLYFRLNVSS